MEIAAYLSLGSRFTVVEGDTVLLYAEWSECNPEQDFEYVLVDREDIVSMYTDTPSSKTPQDAAAESDSEDKIAVITKYKGSSTSKVTIPEKLGGYEVLGIGAYAFEECQEIKGSRRVYSLGQNCVGNGLSLSGTGAQSGKT